MIFGSDHAGDGCWVTDHLYDLDWIVERVAKTRPKPKRPKTYRKNS